MSHLPLLDAENVTLDSAAQVYAYSEKALKVFGEFGLPLKYGRELALQPRPRTLLRAQSLELFKKLNDVKNDGTVESLMLYGKSGSGKSVLMAQSIAHAAEQGWFIVSIPRAIDLIDSSTDYIYSPQHLAYLQPSATKLILESIRLVNRDVLKGIKTSEDVVLEDTTVKQGTGLDDILRLAVDRSTTTASTQTLFEEALRVICAQTERPVLFAIDDVQALFRLSKYVDPDMVPLQSYELGLPRALLPILRQQENFRLRNGVLLSAISNSRTDYLPPPEFEIAFASQHYDKVAMTRSINAYTKLDNQHLANAKEAISKATHIDTSAPLSKTEAAALLTQLRAENIRWSAVNDEFFLAKLTETNGNPRDFSRSLTKTLL